MDLKALCAQVKAAKTFGSGNHMRVGRGVLIVQAVRYNEEAFKGAHVAVDFVVETSANDPMPNPDTKELVVANAPRSSIGKVWAVTGPLAEMNKGFVKKFVAALDGEEGGDVGELLGQLCSDAQPATGMRIGYEASWHLTKTNKKWIASERWISKPNTAEDIASGKAFLASL